ncbi:RcnB family protein [Novosphingobium sp.]|uniref:RcnB family protein n=1 Tax=Novosphingobium sp. TaxID=1874826 RepID=UPI0025CFC678|nr:RcnB family protein [Novosphingobium sp.]
MAVSKNYLSGRRAALALAVAAIALPGIALAEPDNGGWGKRGDRAERVQSDSGQDNGRQSRGGWGARAEQSRNEGGGQTPAWGARNEQSRGNGEQARGWGRNGGNADNAGQVQTRGWAGRSDGNRQQSVPAAAPPQQAAPRWASPSTWGGARDANRRGDESRGGSWAGRDGDRNRDGERRRDGQWTSRDGNSSRDNDRWRSNNQSRYNDQWRNQQSRNTTYTYRDNRQTDYRNWDRRWRNNDRYNWSSYRRYNPSIYRWGTYYSPYRNYSYRRLSIGFYLDSLFYSSRYWINDPYQYRLPDVYGPYRWVRYYDDALLVNVYDGEVVDVIHDFFW